MTPAPSIAEPEASGPRASMIVTTRDRPAFLPIALMCCQAQTYANREVIVVDDGDRHPADPELVASLGATLVLARPGEPLGKKLNRGLAAASGDCCFKIDDDDWYGPGYLTMMIRAMTAGAAEQSRAVFAAAAPFLLFDLRRWEIRRSLARQYAGASLGFRRDDWRASPFAPVSQLEDVTFHNRLIERGVNSIYIPAPESYLAIRHDGFDGNRAHTWSNHHGVSTVEEHLRALPLHDAPPEALLPGWALDVYRSISRQILTSGPPAARIG